MTNYPPSNEQSRPRSRPRLGFQEAMENFSTMFPTMDRSIIEAVLRSCNGHIQQTIDKLLVMTDSSPPNTDTNLNQDPQSLIVLADQENTSHTDANLISIQTDNHDGLTVDHSLNQNTSHNNNNNIASNASTSKYRPPLVGRLPDDFLRIQPVHVQTHHMPAYDPVALQLMEDERLAKWLQNEEFMRHLQSNEDFVRSLESGMYSSCHVILSII